jgi:hypothetical protein
MNVRRCNLLCLILVFLGGCMMSPEKPTPAPQQATNVAKTVAQAAEQMIPVLQAIARLAKQPNAYAEHKIELSATLQLQQRLIEEANRSFAQWPEAQQQRYIQLITEGAGESASLFIGSSSQAPPKTAALASDVKLDAAKQDSRGEAGKTDSLNLSVTPRRDSECICPFCGTWCSCPLVCILITDSAETCENFKQWFLTTQGWMPYLCKPTGRVLPVCYASDAVCNLSSDAASSANCPNR